MTTPDANPEVRKTEYSVCGGVRNCDVRGKHGERGGDENFDWHVDWSILQCRGCEHVFAQTASTNSEDYFPDCDHEGNVTNVHEETLKYWPALLKRKRPEWFHHDNIEVKDAERLEAALAEAYGALENDLKTIAGIGIRTSFNVGSELLGIDTEITFKAKLSSLVEAGHITALDAKDLDVLVEAGNASAHRGWSATTSELSLWISSNALSLARLSNRSGGSATRKLCES